MQAILSRPLWLDFCSVQLLLRCLRAPFAGCGKVYRETNDSVSLLSSPSNIWGRRPYMIPPSPRSPPL